MKHTVIDRTNPDFWKKGKKASRLPAAPMINKIGDGVSMITIDMSDYPDASPEQILEMVLMQALGGADQQLPSPETRTFDDVSAEMEKVAMAMEILTQLGAPVPEDHPIDILMDALFEARAASNLMMDLGVFHPMMGGMPEMLFDPTKMGSLPRLDLCYLPEDEEDDPHIPCNSNLNTPNEGQ